MKLSGKQRMIKKLLLDNEGSVIVGHRKITGTSCYRMVTFDHNPIINIRHETIRGLYQKGVIIKVDREYMINPEMRKKKKAATIKQQPDNSFNSSDNPIT